MRARRLVGDPRALEELLPVMEEAERRSGRGRLERELAGRPAVVKFSPLSGASAWRYGLRQRLGLPPPRLREHANLLWLRARGFDAPEPLAAGVLARRGLPRLQFLATALVPGARTLRELLEAEGGTPAARAALAATGVLAARLHGSGFVHRDLFPRNLLVTGAAETPRVWVLDAWRGGPGPALPRRGTRYDLACLALHAPALATADEERALFEAYFAARAADGAALDPERELAAAASLRAGLVRRLVRKGRTTPPLPPRDWRPPVLADAGTVPVPDPAPAGAGRADAGNGTGTVPASGIRSTSC